MNGGGVLGIKYFTLVIPKPFEPQTNFADATLSVGASQNNQAVTDCLNANESATTSSTSTQKIDGTEFTIFHSDDAGAGNYYKTTSYRALQSGQCYAIEYTVHSSQVANYPATYDIKPFDEAKIDSLLQRIIGTFKFK